MAIVEPMTADSAGDANEMIKPCRICVSSLWLRCVCVRAAKDSMEQNRQQGRNQRDDMQVGRTGMHLLFRGTGHRQPSSANAKRRRQTQAPKEGTRFHPEGSSSTTTKGGER